MHGGGQTRHAWHGTAMALARAGWRAVALDLPGHGESAWSPQGDYHVDKLAADVSRLCHSLGAPLAIVGASLGGMIGMALVGRADAPAVAALALVDVGPWLESAGVDRIVNFMRAHPDGFATLEEAARHIADYRGRPVQAHPRGLGKNLRQNAAGRWVWHWDPRLMNEENHGHRNDPDYLSRSLARFLGPVALIRGGRSDVISAAGAARFCEAFPRARFYELAKAGHMVAGDANDVFTASLIDFLGVAMPAAGAAATASSAANQESNP
tara:strand:- start:1463 stop:2266 length:804 start_codon:yes stop_codon:yes gene_type:complete